jgi:hypothetical protein
MVHENIRVPEVASAAEAQLVPPGTQAPEGAWLQ